MMAPPLPENSDERRCHFHQAKPEFVGSRGTGGEGKASHKKLRLIKSSIPSNLSESIAGKSFAPQPLEKRTAFEIEDRKPVVRAASLHPDPDVKTTIESTVSFELISFEIAVVLT